MSDGKITFATLVATPTKTSWSQAYTAGKLYAVLSLEQEGTGVELAAKGKEIINALVEEYFTLEKKNLDTIKTAVIQTTKKIPESIQASFVVVSLVDTIVYAYAFGGGKILLKRHERVGSILKTPVHEQEQAVHAVSGYVENNDTLILETKQFTEVVHSSDFQATFVNPAEAVEILSPKVHGKENGAASAIVLSYTKDSHPETLAFAPDAFGDEPEKEQEKKEEESDLAEEKVEEVVRSPLEQEVAQKHEEETLRETPVHPTKKGFSFPKLSVRLPLKMLLLLLIPLILLGALGYGLYTTKQQQEQSAIQKLFDDVYPKAEKKYNEGASLLTLNKPLALDDFKKAKTIIDENLNKFPKDSPQRAKMEELLAKIAQQGVSDETNGGTPSLPASEVSSTKSTLLAALIKNKSATYVTGADGSVFVGSNNNIQTAEGKTLIENNDDWGTMSGIGAFNTNIYVLDSENDQILKFLGGSQTSKSTYASGGFTDAISMSIDSSIYVLLKNGAITKYTSGEKQSFSITGLETPLKNPTRIFTNAQTDSVYVLDRGNKRIVKLSKTGSFEDTYASDIIGSASDFDVKENENALYLLSSGKVYELTLP